LFHLVVKYDQESKTGLASKFKSNGTRALRPRKGCWDRAMTFPRGRLRFYASTSARTVSAGHLCNDRERTWIDNGSAGAGHIWIIGVGDCGEIYSSRTQRGLERTSAAVRRTAQHSCQSISSGRTTVPCILQKPFTQPWRHSSGDAATI
jgi:hypothetical protein